MTGLPLFARTFLLGVLVAAPVGAMGVLCVQRTLQLGWRAGFATGLGIATADAIYAGFAAFGITAVSSVFVAWQVPLRLVGGGVLVYLGVASMVRRSRDAPCNADASVSHGSLYASSVALTLTNPLTIMAFGAVFAAAGTHGGAFGFNCRAGDAWCRSRIACLVGRADRSSPCGPTRTRGRRGRLGHAPLRAVHRGLRSDSHRLGGVLTASYGP